MTALGPRACRARRLALPAVALAAAVILAGCGDEPVPEMLERYSVSPDGRTLAIHITTGRCDTVRPPTVVETSEYVSVTILVEPDGPDEPCDSIRPFGQVIPVTLREPLGDRPLRSADNPKPVTQVSTPVAP